MQTNIADVTVREIPGANLRSILPLIMAQNPSLAEQQITQRLDQMKQQGYRCIGAYVGDDLVGIAGFWTGCRFWCGSYIDADNVVVREDVRNLKVGSKMMEWIHAEGRRLGCDVAVLDSYVTYVDAHRFYERMGYEKLGYHFKLELM